MAYTFAIAGSSDYTLKACQNLLKKTGFIPLFAITPKAKPTGRKQDLVKNPVQKWAEANGLPSVLVDGKIDDQEQAAIHTIIDQVGQPDFLIVVDFGYKVPSWLLSLPKHGPINIHPSALPRWRGSSPGQFVLLHGEKQSAVSVIIMTSQFDQGEIIAQLPFKVKNNWTQIEYYQQAFLIVAKQLPSILSDLAEKKITPQPQPSSSPTPLAKKISKEDAFIEWSELNKAMQGRKLKAGRSAQTIERASRAYYPWPIMWTRVPTTKGEKRMKILQTKLVGDRLKLTKVQIEGQLPALWNQVKNLIEN